MSAQRQQRKRGAQRKRGHQDRTRSSQNAKSGIPRPDIQRTVRGGRDADHAHAAKDSPRGPMPSKPAAMSLADPSPAARGRRDIRIQREPDDNFSETGWHQGASLADRLISGKVRRNFLRHEVVETAGTLAGGLLALLRRSGDVPRDLWREPYALGFIYCVIGGLSLHAGIDEEDLPDVMSAAFGAVLDRTHPRAATGAGSDPAGVAAREASHADDLPDDPLADIDISWDGLEDDLAEGEVIGIVIGDDGELDILFEEDDEDNEDWKGGASSENDWTAGDEPVGDGSGGDRPDHSGPDHSGAGHRRSDGNGSDGNRFDSDALDGDALDGLADDDLKDDGRGSDGRGNDGDGVGERLHRARLHRAGLNRLATAIALMTEENSDFIAGVDAGDKVIAVTLGYSDYDDDAAVIDARRDAAVLAAAGREPPDWSDTLMSDDLTAEDLDSFAAAQLSRDEATILCLQQRLFCHELRRRLTGSTWLH